MIKRWKHIGFLVLFFGISINSAFSQEIEPRQEVNIDDLGDISDEFQELFFEALKQKGITNYEKAIEALEKCIELDPKPTYLYFELGKNQLELKQYAQAEKNFNTVLETKPDDKYVLELIFETYFAQYKYKESVAVIEKLVTFNPMFKEQLANLYYLEKRYEEALTAIDELNELYGVDKYRKQLRQRIALKISDPNSQIAKLETKINEAPSNEQNYLNLIYLYSQDNQKEKAFEVAKKLLKEKPKSELAHLALYKFYLDDNKIDEAIESMKTTVASHKIDADSKYKVIHDFIAFLNKKPEYESRLNKVASLFSEDPSNARIFTELGHYYFKREKTEQALNYYERGIANNANDFKLLKRMLLLQLELKRYEKAKIGSELAMELYPAQPIFYLTNGVSLLYLGQAEEALDILVSGVDYVIDDYKMEADFYKQMSEAYIKLGNEKKGTEYLDKSLQLQKKS